MIFWLKINLIHVYKIVIDIDKFILKEQFCMSQSCTHCFKNHYIFTCSLCPYSVIFSQVTFTSQVALKSFKSLKYFLTIPSAFSINAESTLAPSFPLQKVLNNVTLLVDLLFCCFFLNICFIDLAILFDYLPSVGIVVHFSYIVLWG